MNHVILFNGPIYDHAIIIMVGQDFHGMLILKSLPTGVHVIQTQWIDLDCGGSIVQCGLLKYTSYVCNLL